MHAVALASTLYGDFTLDGVGLIAFPSVSRGRRIEIAALVNLPNELLLSRTFRPCAVAEFTNPYVVVTRYPCVGSGMQSRRKMLGVRECPKA